MTGAWALFPIAVFLLDSMPRPRVFSVLSRIPLPVSILLATLAPLATAIAIWKYARRTGHAQSATKGFLAFTCGVPVFGTLVLWRVDLHNAVYGFVMGMLEPGRPGPLPFWLVWYGIQGIVFTIMCAALFFGQLAFLIGAQRGRYGAA